MDTGTLGTLRSLGTLVDTGDSWNSKEPRTLVDTGDSGDAKEPKDPGGHGVLWGR